MTSRCPSCKSSDIWTDSHDRIGRCNKCGHDGCASDFDVLDKKEMAKKARAMKKYDRYKFYEYERDKAWAIVIRIASGKEYKREDMVRRAQNLLNKRP